MGVMGSFGFEKYPDNMIPAEILEVLAKYKDEKVRGEPVYNYAFEIVDAILEGRLRLKNANIVSFVWKIQENKGLVEETEARKKVFITSVCTGEGGTIRLQNSIAENQLADLRDDYEKFEDADEVDWAAAEVRRLNDFYMYEEGVNLISVIKKAAIGFPQAIEKLKELCEIDTRLSDYVFIILSSGMSIDEVFPKDSVVA